MKLSIGQLVGRRRMLEEYRIARGNLPNNNSSSSSSSRSRAMSVATSN